MSLTYNNTFSVQTLGDKTVEQPSHKGQDAFKWLVAWGVMLVILSLINKSRVGHAMIYYSLWLMLIFLIVTQYKFIAEALAPIGTPVPSKIGDK